MVWQCAIGFNIAGESFTLTDDPHMEGLTTSRASMTQACLHGGSHLQLRAESPTGSPTRRPWLFSKRVWQSMAFRPQLSSPADSLRSTFSSIYVGRGRATYRELLNSGDDLLFVCDLDDVRHDGPVGLSSFTATLRSGVTKKWSTAFYRQGHTP